MADYLLEQGTRVTPQSEPIPGTTQVPNSAGGFAWEVDDWTKLRRFLILGSEGGTYYASERELTTKNVMSVRACIAADGPRTVAEIVAISKAGRAPKNEPALYCLAACFALGDLETKRAAEQALPEVVRTGTHLFHFVAYMETMRGWGRLMRRAVGSWYTSKDPERLAYQLVKYRQRDDWSHRDVLRLAHVPAPDIEHAFLHAWAAQPNDVVSALDLEGNEVSIATFPIIEGFIKASRAKTAKKTAKLIAKYNLPREALQTEHLNDPEVWVAMLEQGMPMTALIRNLATMTRIGVLAPTSDATKTVLAQLADEELLRKARVHPIQVLTAMLTYVSGHGLRGKNVWTPVPRITDALNDAFYASFGNVTPTGGRTLLALDVSGSMDSGMVAGVPGLTPRVAAAAMAMVTARVETQYEIVGFHCGSGGVDFGLSSRWGHYHGGITPLAITPRRRLDDIVAYTHGLAMGGTDCALPMVYAHKTKQQFDTFVIYTDNETWAGPVHPAQALRSYRREYVPSAKLIVVAMTSNGFSIADPADAGMMDVCGFDTAAPGLISDFARSGM